MFAVVACPACQYKFSIPEGDMGKRHVCPNCQSPFFAGKSAAEAAALAPALSAAAGANPSFAKTMLGESAPPIRYNCPRCKAPLEAPASEAGIKKPCSACGQRLQVPAAPPPAPIVVQPNLNKTMMASDDSSTAPPIKYNCPNCKKPFESPAIEGGTKKNCPACGQRFQIPTASAPKPNLMQTRLATDESKGPPAGVHPGYPPTVPAGVGAGGAPGGPATPATPFTPRNIAIGAVVLLLLLLVVPAFIRGGKVEDTAALAKAQLELEKLKAEIKLRELDLEKQKAADADTRKKLDDMAALIREQDAKSRDAAKQAEWEKQKREMEKDYQRLLEKAEAGLKEKQRALEAAQQAQVKTQTIIQQPPVIYYPPYHPRYYWPFGW